MHRIAFSLFTTTLSCAPLLAACGTDAGVLADARRSFVIDAESTQDAFAVLDAPHPASDAPLAQIDAASIDAVLAHADAAAPDAPLAHIDATDIDALLSDVDAPPPDASAADATVATIDANSAPRIIDYNPTSFSQPTGVAIDSHGNIYVSEYGANHISKIGTDGTVSVFAGNGTAGFADGTGGANGTAQFNSPYGIAIDGDDNLYVGDYFNFAVRKIDPAGNVTTLAQNDGFIGPNGRAAPAFDVAVDSHGNVFATVGGSVVEIDTSLNVSTFATGFSNGYNGIAVDGNDNIYVGDYGNDCVHMMNASGLVSTLAGNGPPGFVDGTGGATGTAEFHTPVGVWADSAGNVFVADYGNNSIREIDAGGNVTTLGSGQFSFPWAVTVDASGDVFVLDLGDGFVHEIIP